MSDPGTGNLGQVGEAAASQKAGHVARSFASFRPSSLLLSRACDTRRVDLDTHTLGRAKRDLVDVIALRTRRLGPYDGVDERLDVLGELLLGEARLADAGLHDARLLDAELDGAALGGLHGGRDIHGDGAD